MWYQKFDTYILGLDFVQSNIDHCVYLKKIDNNFFYHNIFCWWYVINMK